MKHLKQYEDFSGSENNEMSEDLNFENSIWEDQEETLTPGERRALSRGLDIMTEEQAAVCYLFAKDKSNMIYNAMGSTGMGYNPLKNEDLAGAIGMKYPSFLYAVKKFRILLNKEEQGEQSLYPKITDFFDSFYSMTDQEVAEIAKGAFTEEAMQKGEEYKSGAMQKQAQKSLKDVNFTGAIRQYYRGIFSIYQQKGLSIPDVKDKAIRLTASKMEITPQEVMKAIENL